MSRIHGSVYHLHNAPKQMTSAAKGLTTRLPLSALFLIQLLLSIFHANLELEIDHKAAPTNWQDFFIPLLGGLAIVSAWAKRCGHSRVGSESICQHST